MRDNVTTFRVELEVSAQRVIHQFMAHNELVEEQLRNAIQKTVENFDFEKEVQEIATRQLRQAIREAMEYGPLKKKVEEVASKIYGELIEKEFAKYK